MNNRTKKILKISLLTFAILCCISIPIILYFTIGQKETASNGTVNLDDEVVSYLAQVNHMDLITEPEANKIKSDIQTTITNKMSSLNLEENVDYTVQNLDKIKKDFNLNDLNIIVDSIESSTKATGNLAVSVSVQEDISDRSIGIIKIDATDAAGLRPRIANDLQINITLSVEDVLTQGQFNELDIDYSIINLDLIKAGAKFEEYSTKISVEATAITTRLKGLFKITFELES